MTAERPPLSETQLRVIALGTALNRQRWAGLVRYDAHKRWYQRLHRADDYEVWLLSWLPGQDTGFHDHGCSAGAFAVAHGALEERTAPDGQPAPAAATVAPGVTRAFGPWYVHDVRNATDLPAVSVHVYSPPLSTMCRYTVTDGGLLPAIVDTVAD